MLVPGFACDVSIHAFNSMNKAMLLPKFYRTVCRWWFWIFYFLALSNGAYVLRSNPSPFSILLASWYQLYIFQAIEYIIFIIFWNKLQYAFDIYSVIREGNGLFGVRFDNQAGRYVVMIWAA